MVTVLIILLFYLGCGISFYLGLKLKNKIIEEKVEQIVEKIRYPIGRQELKPGVIKRPSAQDINYRKDEKFAEREAIRKTLDQIPELQEARKQMELQKKLERV